MVMGQGINSKGKGQENYQGLYQCLLRGGPDGIHYTCLRKACRANVDTG